MEFRWTESLGLATFCLLAAGAAGQSASGDAYAPLRLYEGAWGSSRHYAGEEDRQNRESLRKDRKIFQLRAGGQR